MINHSIIRNLSLGLLLGLAACGNPRQELVEQIASLEYKISKNPDDAQCRSLMTLYAQYIQKYPQDEYSPIYIYKMAEVYYRVQSWAEAVRHLNMILEKYPNSPITEEVLMFAGMLYDERLYDQAGGDKIYKLYLEKFPNGKGKQAAEMHFKSPQERLLFRIENMRKELEKEPNNLMLATSLAFAYKNYVQANPQDPKNPELCMQGAKLAAGSGESFLAIELWDMIIINNPDFDQRPYALFLSAMEHEEKAYIQSLRYKQSGQPFEGACAKYKDVDKEGYLQIAKERYKLYLSQYPKHELADDAQIAIQNLGKDINEIVQSFTTKNNKPK